MLSAVGVRSVVHTVCFLFVDKELEFQKKLLMIKKKTLMLIKLHNWVFVQRLACDPLFLTKSEKFKSRLVNRRRCRFPQTQRGGTCNCACLSPTEHVVACNYFVMYGCYSCTSVSFLCVEAFLSGEWWGESDL